MHGRSEVTREPRAAEHRRDGNIKAPAVVFESERRCQVEKGKPA